MQSRLAPDAPEEPSQLRTSIYICDCALPRSMPHHPNSLLCNFFLFSFRSAFRRKEVKRKSGGSVDIPSLLGTDPAQKADAPEPSRREADQYFHVWAFARDHSMPSTATKRRPSQQLVRISPHRADYSASSRDREKEKRRRNVALYILFCSRSYG